jgi:hypothetical protein
MQTVSVKNGFLIILEKSMKFSTSLILLICLGSFINLTVKSPEPYNKQETSSKAVEAVTEPQKTLPKPIALESKPEPLKVKLDVDNYQPRWDIEGNYSKALDRQSLITHLNGENHKFSLQKLNAMSTDDLQKLHDTDHENKRSFKPAPFTLFRRLMR